MTSARYFTRLGFAVLQGPEIETDANNFDALNIPPDHPAREGLDSFYLRPDLVLRTHTSPMQVRAMRESGPPIAVIVPGKAYRRDAVDARHLYQFHQVEGLMVGHGIHFGHLKGVLTGMMRELFGPHQDVRFRPSFFPFTEPSAEIDTTCPGCAGSGNATTCNAVPAAVRVGSRSAVRGWCIRTCCAPSATIPTSSPAGPSASAPSASRWCATR